MKHDIYIPAFFMVLFGLLTAGCGDSVLPEEDGARDVIRIFGEVNLPDEKRLRLRIDVGRDGEEHLVRFVDGEGGELIVPNGPLYIVDFLDLDEDSLHFDISSGGRRPLKFNAWVSDIIYIGSVWPDGEREDSTFSFDGQGCRSLAPGNGGAFTNTPVEVAYPIDPVLPGYPDSLVSAGVQGTVRVQVRVGFCGTPLKVTLSRTAHEMLDQLVMDTVMDWDYYPGRFFKTYVTLDQFISVQFEIDEFDRGTATLQVGI